MFNNIDYNNDNDHDDQCQHLLKIKKAPVMRMCS